MVYKSKDLAIASDKRIQREVGMNFELISSKKWPKWKRKMPVTMTMLQKCHEAAKEVSARSGVEIAVTRDEYSETSDEYVFKTSFDARNMTEEKFLKEIERYCKAMVKAYRKYEPWLTGSEYWKLILAQKLKK